MSLGKNNPWHGIVSVKLSKCNQGRDMAVLRSGDEVAFPVFYTLKEAQIIIEQWGKHYNTKRPHSALGYRPPAPETIVPMDQEPVMH